MYIISCTCVSYPFICSTKKAITVLINSLTLLCHILLSITATALPPPERKLLCLRCYWR